MLMVPGSHRWPILDHTRRASSWGLRSDAGGHRPPAGRTGGGSRRRDHLHHCRTAHGSAVNTSPPRGACSDGAGRGGRLAVPGRRGSGRLRRQDPAGTAHGQIPGEDHGHPGSFPKHERVGSIYEIQTACVASHSPRGRWASPPEAEAALDPALRQDGLFSADLEIGDWRESQGTEPGDAPTSDDAPGPAQKSDRQGGAGLLALIREKHEPPRRQGHQGHELTFLYRRTRSRTRVILRSSRLCPNEPCWRWRTWRLGGSRISDWG